MTEISAVLSVGFTPQAEARRETVLECAFPVPEIQGQNGFDAAFIAKNLNLSLDAVTAMLISLNDK